MRTPALDHFYLVIGDAINAHRKERGMTITGLAKEAGCSQQTLDNAIGGMGCSLYLAASLATALDVTLDDLVPLAAMEKS